MTGNSKAGPTGRPGKTIVTASQLPAQGWEVNGHSHRMFCWCLPLLPFPWSQRTAALHPGLQVAVTRIDNKRFVAHGFGHCARSSLRCSGGTHGSGRVHAIRNVCYLFSWLNPCLRFGPSGYSERRMQPRQTCAVKKLFLSRSPRRPSGSAI